MDIVSVLFMLCFWIKPLKIHLLYYHGKLDTLRTIDIYLAQCFGAQRSYNSLSDGSKQVTSVGSALITRRLFGV